MFSGLIAHAGRVGAVEGDDARGLRLSVCAPEAVAEGVAVKDSVAVNGVCLTVVAVDGGAMQFDVVPETVRRSALAALRAGDAVNVELSLRVGDRLGGHLVYGHVDASAAILAKQPEGQGHRLTIEAPPEMAQLIVEKGYVAVDGVSLTVASLVPGGFTVALIPETARRTTLGVKATGDRVNLEADPVARYALAAVAAYAGNEATHDEIAWAYEI